MFKRLVVPLTAIAALIALFAVVSPTGASGQSRGGDSHFVNQHARIDQPVLGSVQMYGGSLIVASVISGDLLAIGGTVSFGPNGRVNGNFIHANTKIIGAEGRVKGEISPLASLEGAAGALTKNAIVASLLLVWLIVAVVVTLMSGREIRLSSQEVRTSALHCFVLGLVALTSFVLTAIAFSYLIPYVIGIPLLAALAVFGILTKVYGMIAMFHAVGTLIAGSRTRAQLGQRKWLRGDLAMVVIGVLILGAIRLIPVVGTILWSLASIFGFGVALATKFGRREPWFLEFRSAAA
jgi:hypothetical protein